MGGNLRSQVQLGNEGKRFKDHRLEACATTPTLKGEGVYGKMVLMIILLVSFMEKRYLKLKA